MAWNKLLPAGATKIKDSDDAIRANNAAIETVLGTNITAGPTSIQDAIRGDGTKGRKLRSIQLLIQDGTNATTLKCTVSSRWNGDTIAVTDNIIKDATTGHFTSSSGGIGLAILQTGLAGNVVFDTGDILFNDTGTALTLSTYAESNNIYMACYNATTGDAKDLMLLVDTAKSIRINFLYATDA